MLCHAVNGLPGVISNTEKCYSVRQSGVDNLYLAFAEVFTVQETLQAKANVAISLPGSLGKAFPPIVIEVAEANVLVSSGETDIATTDGKEIPIMRGMYLFAGTSLAADAIKSIAIYVLNISGAVLVSQLESSK